jgi:Mg/Co/Ni transporter MgtE
MDEIIDQLTHHPADILGELIPDHKREIFNRLDDQRTITTIQKSALRNALIP